METGTLSRAALGSTAFLGDLYDARRDDFCGINVFQAAIPPSAINSQDSNFSDIHFVHSDNYSEKFSKMDVSAELQVSALAGLFTLSGSGCYLSDTKKSARTIKGSLIYNIKTKDENVNVFHQELRETFSLDAIKTDMATHVVVGISWGANSVVTCTYQNTENKDVKEIEGKLSAQLKYLSLSLSRSGKSKVDLEEGDNSNGLSFDIRMYGDVLPQNEELPTTFQGALEFMKKLPTLIATSNVGKGKPITFKLLPIAVIKKYLNVSMGTEAAIVKLNEASLLRVVQLFDEISATMQQFNDFYQDIQEYAMYVPDDKLDEIRTFRNKMIIFESSIKTQFCNNLLALRSGTAAISELDAIIQDFYSSDLSSSNISTKLASWNHLNRKIGFVRVLIKDGVKLLGKNENLEEKLLELGDNAIYALFFTTSARSNAPKQWQQNTHLFLKAARTETRNTLYYAIDMDFYPVAKPPKHSICVQVFHDGECIETDLFGEKIDFSGNIQSQMAWLPDSSSNTNKAVHPFAVLAGLDKSGNPCYVCRASSPEFCCPPKFSFAYPERIIYPGASIRCVPLSGALVVGEASKTAYIVTKFGELQDYYEILVSPPWAYTWEKFTGTVPASAINAGISDTTYIGRAFIKESVVVGTVASRELYFCCENKEPEFTKEFEILIRSPIGIKLGI